ncbi:uncharacterized protein [Danio rerio]|uniref:Uncharacterized protein n=1 Tax=Danio rerio TaxID=7955 RepID=A0AC58G5L1_DANRE
MKRRRGRYNLKWGLEIKQRLWEKLDRPVLLEIVQVWVQHPSSDHGGHQQRAAAQGAPKEEAQALSHHIVPDEGSRARRSSSDRKWRPVLWEALLLLLLLLLSFLSTCSLDSGSLLTCTQCNTDAAPGEALIEALEAVKCQIRSLEVKRTRLRERALLVVPHAMAASSEVSGRYIHITPSTSTPCVSLPRPSALRMRFAQALFTPTPGYHGPWVQQRKVLARSRGRTSPPPVFQIFTENRFAPLRETGRVITIIGDSIVRHIHAASSKDCEENSNEKLEFDPEWLVILKATVNLQKPSHSFWNSPLDSRFRTHTMITVAHFLIAFLIAY